MIATDWKEAPSEADIARLRQRFPCEPLIDATLTRKMRGRANGPHRSMSTEEVAKRLTAFLTSRLPGGFEISEVRTLAGGSSKEQFAFRLRWTDDSGATQDEQLALRMRPAESIVETHPLREYQALAAARGTIAVPPLRWIDPEGAELGQPALIYGFVPGIAKPPRDGAYNPRGGFGPHYRALLGPQFIDAFAKLSLIDWRTSDMSAFDPPPLGSNAGVLQMIAWWERVWAEDSVEALPLMTLAADWLRANAPPIDHVSIVHQDFRGGNFLFDAASGQITAFLDWELAYLGDRHADLAYFMAPHFTEVDAETGETLLGGLVEQKHFLAEYQRLSGLPVDPARLEYYDVFQNWRSVINALATAPRIMHGQKTHQDIRVGWITGVAPLLLDRLLTVLEGKL